MVATLLDAASIAVIARHVELSSGMEMHTPLLPTSETGEENLNHTTEDTSVIVS